MSRYFFISNRMSSKFAYYTGYEQDDESSNDEEVLNDSKSEDEFENDFSEYLKSIKKSEKPKEKQKNESKKFEDEMSQELDNFIQIQEKKYTEILNNQPKQSTKQEYEEESDTDSEAELETGVRTTKKRQHFTNDELLYDPEADEIDEQWINSQRKTCKKIPSPAKKPLKSILKPSTSDDTPKTSEETNYMYTDSKTDAVLNCPCCMTVLSMDCQRHEKYKTQFRAMFVFNCTVKQDEQLKYPKQKNKKFSKKNQSEQTNESIEEFDIYKPVECSQCKTEVGVFDPKDEMYHFFNVLISHS